MKKLDSKTGIGKDSSEMDDLKIYQSSSILDGNYLQFALDSVGIGQREVLWIDWSHLYYSILSRNYLYCSNILVRFENDLEMGLLYLVRFFKLSYTKVNSIDPSESASQIQIHKRLVAAENFVENNYLLSQIKGIIYGTQTSPYVLNK